MHKIIPLTDGFVVKPMSSANVFGHLHLSSTFVPTWFQIADDIAQHFLITDIKIGRDFQLLSTGCVPASLFAASMRHKINLEQVGLKLDVLKPDQLITLSVTNIGREPLPFAADVIGYYPKDLSPALMKRHYLVGFGHTPISPQSSATISVQPQRDLRPQLLFVSDHVRERFLINDLSASALGNRPKNRVPSQMLNPARLTSIGLIEMFPNPNVSNTEFFALSVQNITVIEQSFTAAVLGTAIPTTEETTEK